MHVNPSHNQRFPSGYTLHNCSLLLEIFSVANNIFIRWHTDHWSYHSRTYPRCLRCLARRIWATACGIHGESVEMWNSNEALDCFSKNHVLHQKWSQNSYSKWWAPEVYAYFALLHGTQKVKMTPNKRKITGADATRVKRWVARPLLWYQMNHSTNDLRAKHDLGVISTSKP